VIHKVAKEDGKESKIFSSVSVQILWK